jgi:hypothetical protein
MADVQGGKLAPLDAAALLGCTPRHLRRLAARYAKDGPASVAHRNRGRHPPNKTPPSTLERIIGLAGKEGDLRNFNVCHMQDMLEESEDIVIGRSTLDRLLVENNLRDRDSKTKRQHRSRRERRKAEGMLLQTDGSLHLWFGPDCARCCLIASIDDATGKVVYGHFRPTEDQIGYLRMIQTVAITHGLPMAFYHDKHTILKSPAKITIDDELAGREPMSQIQRILHDLGIESIAAHSPQAKGRIERLFNTFQDRLCKELALARITTIDAGNVFLSSFIERFNKKFAVAPADPEAVWVPIGDIDQGYFFATTEERTVRKDHTVAWNGQNLQITSRQTNLAGKKVQVRTDASGINRIYDGKLKLEFRIVDPTEKAQVELPITPDRGKDIADKPVTRKSKAWLYAQL